MYFSFDIDDTQYVAYCTLSFLWADNPYTEKDCAGLCDFAQEHRPEDESLSLLVDSSRELPYEDEPN